MHSKNLLLLPLLGVASAAALDPRDVAAQAPGESLSDFLLRRGFGVEQAEPRAAAADSSSSSSDLATRATLREHANALHFALFDDAMSRCYEHAHRNPYVYTLCAWRVKSARYRFNIHVPQWACEDCWGWTEDDETYNMVVQAHTLIRTQEFATREEAEAVRAQLADSHGTEILARVRLPAIEGGPSGDDWSDVDDESLADERREEIEQLEKAAEKAGDKQTWGQYLQSWINPFSWGGGKQKQS